jgi:hypothetical protein
MKIKLTLYLILIGFLPLVAQQAAFPDAKGFGKYAVGGRGGIVYHVTNLNDSGVGSFRNAVNQSRRTIVFDVSGVIHIKSKINISSNITIAGQTAPGVGIVVYGNGVGMTGASDVIIRYIRFRGSVNMARGTCSLSCDNANNVILDHVSIEWGRWDNLHIKDSKNVTLQYCLIGEGINPQMFGALLENPTNITIDHCLWVDNQSRNPKAKAGIEIINNVVYNWGSNGLVGGHSAAVHNQDVLNNYFIAGPSSSNSFIGMFTQTDEVYQSGNLVDLDKDGILSGLSVSNEDFKKTGATIKSAKQHAGCDLSNVQSAELAYKDVIINVGASKVRDEVDARLIGYVKSLGKEGLIIKSEEEVGGQKELKQEVSAKDTDRDGIPDAWELSHGLNPKNLKDAGKIMSDGYSNLEKYINCIVK